MASWLLFNSVAPFLLTLQNVSRCGDGLERTLSLRRHWLLWVSPLVLGAIVLRLDGFLATCARTRTQLLVTASATRTAEKLLSSRFCRIMRVVESGRRFCPRSWKTYDLWDIGVSFLAVPAILRTGRMVSIGISAGDPQDHSTLTTTKYWNSDGRTQRMRTNKQSPVGGYGGNCDGGRGRDSQKIRSA
jgi:hypothetical protein